MWWTTSHGAKRSIADSHRRVPCGVVAPAAKVGLLVLSALVLNATYEPLSVVSAHRATWLVMADKADVVEHDGSELRTVSRSFAVPSVIRLRYVVRVPYHRRAAVSRRAVFARDDHRCQYCGGAADSIDHVMPRSRGGGHSWDNVAAACRPCNLAKRDRTPAEAGMRLARVPAPPREQSWIAVAVSRVPDTWKPYLAWAG